MILKLSLTVLLLYYLAVLWKYYRQDIAGIFGTAETDEDTDGTGKEPGQPGKPYTVMGESTYLPFAAEDGEEESSFWSTTMTLISYLDSSRATAQPTAPAPTMTTSVFFMRSILPS